MSYLAMTAAPVDESNEPQRDTKDIINNLKKINKQNRTRRRTNGILKNKQEQDNNISSLHDDADDNYDNIESSETNDLEEFSPLSLPESSGVERRKERETLSDKDRKEIQNHDITPYTNMANQLSEQPSNINDVPMGSDINTNGYHKNTPSYYNNNVGYADNIPNKTELTEKLNYLINLLEEQQDERTQNVTEEVILYSFLGIFIIFVVDSFARVGKYVR